MKLLPFDLGLAEQASGRGIHHIDLARGDTPQKRVLGTTLFEVAEGSVAVPGPVSLCRQAARAPLFAARDAVLRHPPVRAAVRRGLRIVGSVRSTL